MSHRICVITHVGYDEVVDIIRRMAASASASFAELERHYFQQGYIHADSLAAGLRALGHDCIQMLYNLEALQKLWAAEHRISFGEATWPQEIALAQIKAWRPDVVLIQGMHRDPRLTLVPTWEFHSDCRFVKLVVAISGYPMEPEVARWVDVIVANSPALRRHYRAAGAPVELVYHAFDERIPAQLAAWRASRAEAAEPCDFTFAGSTGLGWGAGHRSRYWDLVHLLAETPIELWGYEQADDPSLRPPALARLAASLEPLLRCLPGRQLVALLRRLCESAFGTDSPRLPLGAVFPDRCHGPLFGMAMYDLIARSRLSFNRHADAGADVGNMRMFHATGLGSCLVTDGGDNLGDLFEPGAEIVVYRSIEECAEAVGYLLAHEAERRAIAEAGRRRTLREHSYARRAEELDALIGRALNKGRPRAAALD